MAKPRVSLMQRFLNKVEKGGNALPHPATLFGILALSVLFFSWIGSLLDWEAIHPATGADIKIVNLLAKDEFHKLIQDMAKIYTSFTPLGIVMLALIGLGVAESSGFLSAAIRLLISKAPPKMLTFIIVFTGVLSNTASDLGYVLIIPLAGIIFHSVGRHPIAGMSAAFAGVSGGFKRQPFYRYYRSNACRNLHGSSPDSFTWLYRFNHSKLLFYGSFCSNHYLYRYLGQ